MSDQELVSNILAGDMDAFRMLIDRHQRLVVHIIARLVDHDVEREELCQDVFMQVYNKLGSFHFESKLSTWIATIAYRMAVNFLRKKQRKPREDDLDSIAFQAGREDLSFERTDYAQFIQGLVAQMPEAYRTVLTLFYLDGFSYPEIVKITNMPEGTVKNYLFRARGKLKELSKPYIGTEIDY